MTRKPSVDLVFITNTRGSLEDFEGVYSREFPNWQDTNFTPPDVYNWKGVRLVTPDGNQVYCRFVVIGSDAFDIVDGINGFRKATNQTTQAIKYAQDLGARVVCFGAGTKKLISIKKLHELNNTGLIFSNGDTVTTGIAIQQLSTLTDQLEINLDSLETTILVVGAYGVIGTQLSKFLSNHNCHLILVGPKLEMLEKLIEQDFNTNQVELYTKLDQIRQQKINVILTATNHPESLVTPSQLRDWGEYMLAIDIAEPANIKQDVVQAMRGRLIRVDGALVDNKGFSSEYSPLIGLKEHQAFACLAEGLVIANAIKTGNLEFTDTQLMEVDGSIINLLVRLTTTAGFQLSNPTNFGIPIKTTEFQQWREQCRKVHPHLYAVQA